MKRILCEIFIIFVTALMLFSCSPKNNLSEKTNNIDNTSVNSVTIGNGKEKITKEMVYNGVNNYCHKNFDWDIAKDNPDIMYVEMGEETDTEYQVIFRSYTGSFTYFYVNKTDGNTRIVEYVPAMNIKEEAGAINLFDYLDKNN